MAWETRYRWAENDKGYLVKVPYKVWVPDPPAPSKTAVGVPKQTTTTKPATTTTTATVARPSQAVINDAAKRKAETEARLAAERRGAWELLQKRYQVLLDARRRKAADAKRTAAEASLASRIEKADERPVSSTGSKPTDARLKKLNESVTAGEARRLKAMQDLQRTGDYEAVFRQIERQQTATGGRYIDSKLYEAASQRLVDDARMAEQAVIPLFERARDLIERAQHAENVGDSEAAAQRWLQVQQLVSSAAYKQAYDNYAVWFGDGRKPGRVQTVAEMQNRIARNRDRWLTSVVFGANPSSATELRKAQERAQKALSVRSAGGQRLDMDGPVTKSQHYEIGLQTYLDRIDAGQQAEYRERYRRTFHGPQPIEHQVDERQAKTLNRIFRLVQEYETLNPREFASVMADLRSSNGARQELAVQRLIQAADAAYKKQVYDPNTAVGFSRIQRQREVFRRMVHEALTGNEGPDGIGAFFQRLLGAPVLGPGLEGLQSVASTTVSGPIRNLVSSLTGGGLLAGRDINFDRDSGKDFISMPEGVGELNEYGVDVGRDTRAANLRAQREVEEILSDPDADFITRLRAHNMYGGGFIQGNIGIAVEGVLDPLNFVGLGPFLRSGRLAISTSGALKGLNRVARFQDDFWKFSLPRKWGGLGGDVVQEMARRHALAKELRIEPRSVYGLAPEQVTRLAEEALLRSRGNPARAGRIERLFNADPIRTQQLLAAASGESRRQLRGIENPLSYHRLMKQADEAIERARRHRVAAERRAKANIDREASVRALSEVEFQRRTKARELHPSGQVRVEVAPGYYRSVRPKKTVVGDDGGLGFADDVGPTWSYRRDPKTGKMVQHQRLRKDMPVDRARLEAAYARAVESESKLTTLAERYVTELRTLRDQTGRAAAYDKLQRVLAKLDVYKTRQIETPEGPATQRGLVDIARIDLDNFDARFRSLQRRPDGSVPAAGVIDLQGARLDRSIAHIRTEMKRLRSEFRLAPSNKARRKLGRALRRHQLALDQAKLVRRLTSDQQKTTRRRLRKYGDRLRNAISVDRVAPYVETTDQVGASTMRDLRSLALDSEVQPVSYTPATANSRHLASRSAVIRALAPERIPTLKTANEFFDTPIDPIVLYDYLHRIPERQLEPEAQILRQQLSEFLREGVKVPLDAADSIRLADAEALSKRLAAEIAKLDEVIDAPSEVKAKHGGPTPLPKKDARLPFKLDLKKIADRKNPDGWHAPDVWGMREELLAFDRRIFIQHSEAGRKAAKAEREAWEKKLDTAKARVVEKMKETGVPPIVNWVKRGVRKDGGPQWTPRTLEDLAAAEVLREYFDRIPSRLWRESGGTVPLTRPVNTKKSPRRGPNRTAAAKRKAKATEELREAQATVSRLRTKRDSIDWDDAQIEAAARAYVDDLRQQESLPDWDRYREIDTEMSRQIEAARGWRAKGQFKQSARGLDENLLEDVEPRARRFRDSDLGVILAKASVVDRYGLTMDTWDELRAVGRDPLLREGRAVSLLNDSRRLQRNQGGEIGEHYLSLREKAREAEVISNAERLGSHPAVSFMDDESFVSLYEERFVLEDLGMTGYGRRVISDVQERFLRNAYESRVGAKLEDNQAALKHIAERFDIPFGNRNAMRDWLVARGFWSPRTREQVSSDAVVWTAEMERRWWEARFGYTPPWTDPAELAKIKHSKDLWDAKQVEWGVLDSDFEKLMIVGHLTPQELKEGIFWGAHGVKQARTIDELRAWMIQRFGREVSEDGVTLSALPWLMDPLAEEYAIWQRSMFQRGYTEPKFFGDLGLQLDPSLIRESQVDGLADAVTHAVRSRIKAWKKRGDLEDLSILPEQYNAFLYDVVDYLLAEKSWRTFWQRHPPAGILPHLIGGFFRAFMVLTPAFPTVNLIDAYGLRRLILAITKNGFRPLSWDVPRWVREAVPNTEALGLSYSATFHVRTRNGFTNARDDGLRASTRAKEALRGLNEIPLRVSKFGEDRLRLDFVRSQIASEWRRLVKSGVSDADARIQAMASGKLMLKTLFPSLDDAHWSVRVLNDIVPFLHYNFTLKRLTLRLAVEHPWLILWGDRLAEYINEFNAQEWEAEHPGLPMPFEMYDKLDIKVGDEVYTLDVSSFSDWTRSFDLINDAQTPADLIREVFRVPHPGQSIFFAAMFGWNDGKTPWGTEARYQDISIWFEWWHQMTTPFDPTDPRSLNDIQAWSQLFFFKPLGRIDPLRVKVQTFYALRDRDMDKAYEFLDQNGDVKLWLQMHARGRFDPFDKAFRHSWFVSRSDEEVARFEAAREGYEHLQGVFDEALDKHYLEPWSPEYRQLKKDRRLALASYLKQNPILTEVWGFNMEPSEWAEVMNGWVVDELLDQYFDSAKTRPIESDYSTELEYAEALSAWIDAREAWLKAHPQVTQVLKYARTEVEQAWFDHEAKWAEIMEYQAELKIRRLKEEAKGSAADRDIIDVIYALSNNNYQRLDAESFGRFYDALDTDVRQGKTSNSLTRMVASLAGRLKQTVSFPGRSDYFYENASPAEQSQIRADERYFRDIGAFMENLSDPKTFWSELEKNPRLRDEYLSRNEDRRVDYDYAMAIGRVFAKGGYKYFWDNLVADPALLQQYLDRGGADARARYNKYLVGKRYFNEITALYNASDGGKNFYALLEKNPWLRDQYYARHPEKQGNSRYFAEITALYRQSTSGRDFFERLDKNPWLKAEYLRRHPDKAASWEAGKVYYDWMKRWVSALQAGNSSLAKRVWDSMPAWVRQRYFEGGGRSPGESAGVLRGSEYYNAIGGWVELLRAKKYEEAAAYFRALPAWMQEKYYAKHPDQRAKNELDNDVLAQAARYFLASGSDRIRELEANPQFARWLKEHGGDEAAYRGLLFAIYRSLPAGEAWLRRTFRERYPEVFSREAAAKRKLASIERHLADNPELMPYYAKQLALQRRLYEESSRRMGAPPKPMTRERKRRFRKRIRRRTARFGSHWSTHRELRLNLR